MFFVLFPQNFAYLKNRLVSVCDSFMGEKYAVPDKMSEIKEKLKRVNSNIVNIFNTLQFTIENFKKFLISSHESDIMEEFSLLRVYQLYLKKAKLNYYTLNKFKQDKTILIGLFWVPTKLA